MCKADLQKMMVCRAPTYPPKTGPTPKKIIAFLRIFFFQIFIMFTYPGFKFYVDIVNQCPHSLSPLISIWSISLAMGMKDMSHCSKTVALNPLIPGNWEFNMVRHASMVLSSNISPPSNWTFEFISKLTVSKLIHELFVIVSASNSISLSIVLSLWIHFDYSPWLHHWFSVFSH